MGKVRISTLNSKRIWKAVAEVVAHVEEKVLLSYCLPAPTCGAALNALDGLDSGSGPKGEDGFFVTIEKKT
jgi:hypothetical protein